MRRLANLISVAERFAPRRRRKFVQGENSMTSPTYQIPTEVREFAEKSVEQARKAFEGFSGAAQKAIAAVDTSALPVAANAKDVGVTALGYAEANVKAAFDLASKLVQAKDVQEVLTLQTEFAKTQFTAFQEQTKELAAALQKAATPK
jgi:phasin